MSRFIGDTLITWIALYGACIVIELIPIVVDNGKTVLYGAFILVATMLLVPTVCVSLAPLSHLERLFR